MADSEFTPKPSAPVPVVDVTAVKIVDVSIPFGSMVTLMVTLGIAAIPVALILGLLYLAAAAILVVATR